MAATNNPPEVQIGVSREIAEFILDNCDVNLAFALQNLQKVSEPTAIKLVEQMDKFKAVRDAVKKGLAE